jgi:hypothetical protein
VGFDSLTFRFTFMPSKTREVSSRWTPALSKEGWTPISDFFLDNYCKLSPAIKGPEVLLIIHLMRHKWDENAPFPAFKTLAKRMGISPAAVRSHARSLDDRLRQPVFLGMREDKNAIEVIREKASP